MCLRDSPPRFGASPQRKKTFVAITTSSRRACRPSKRPVISSDTPSEYMSAVSKRLIPSSRARTTKGSASASGSTHGRHDGSP